MVLPALDNLGSPEHLKVLTSGTTKLSILMLVTPNYAVRLYVFVKQTNSL